jgi:hypothetical protein
LLDEFVRTAVCERQWGVVGLVLDLEVGTVIDLEYANACRFGDANNLAQRRHASD